jgi:glycosyltransferase involved in cell wall biosynthesis
MERPLHIVLELALIAEAKRGIDYYIDYLVDALAKVDAKNRYTLFAYFFKDHAALSARLPRPKVANFTTRYVRFPESIIRSLDHKRGWPVVRRLLPSTPDVYHVLAGGCLPRLEGPKTVVTFFDLWQETRPAGAKADPSVIRSPETYALAGRADHLIATSKMVKDSLKLHYKLPDEKITVLTSGVDLDRFRRINDSAVLRDTRLRYGLPERFLLVIGPYVPALRTNAEFTLRALAALKEGPGKGVALVFTGKKDAALEKLLALAGELGVSAHATGYIDVDDLPGVYSLAEAVAHPTSIEGFGFGLEVMACGTPFLTSTTVVEAMGDAALLVPPQDLAALTRALSRLLSDAGLRQDYARRGVERAKLFSYPEIARTLVGVYERLAAPAARGVS